MLSLLKQKAKSVLYGFTLGVLIYLNWPIAVAEGTTHLFVETTFMLLTQTRCSNIVYFGKVFAMTTSPTSCQPGRGFAIVQTLLSNLPRKGVLEDGFPRYVRVKCVSWTACEKEVSCNLVFSHEDGGWTIPERPLAWVGFQLERPVTKWDRPVKDLLARHTI